MSRKRLWVGGAPDDPGVDDLIWRRPADGPSSFQANIDPGLKALGPVGRENRDAVWLATSVFLADRTTRRRKGWRREISLSVPVALPRRWRAVREDLEGALNFLTSDFWTLEFTEAAITDTKGKPTPRPEIDVVSLFSGGADSMCGAVKLLAEGHRVALVSHWDWTGHAGIQQQLAHELRERLKLDIQHIQHRQIQLGRGSRQIDGSAFPDEPSRRSRSLLFLSLGLAVASIEPVVPLWIPENGFASLNPPLAPERLGALSTRTTHPSVLRSLREVLAAVGAHADLGNPFEAATKGEMFAEVASLLGRQEAADLLSKTHSCAHVRLAGMFQRPPQTHCGACFGCFIRRAAFVSSGLDDGTMYLITDLSGADLNRFLRTPMVRADIEAVRYAVTRTLTPADALALSLPDGYDIAQAWDLIQRGFAELRQVELP